MKSIGWMIVFALAVLGFQPLQAAEPGRALGTVAIDEWAIAQAAKSGGLVALVSCASMARNS